MNQSSIRQETKFKIQSYGIAELGMLYNPSLQPESASRALRRWIDYNDALSNALYDNGWHKGQRRFTPLQTQQIVRFLGEP